MPKLPKNNRPDAPSLTAKQLGRLAWVRINSPSKERPFIRAYSGKSPAAGIKAQCLDCTGCDASAIRECRATGCPLWMYRPYQQREAHGDR